MDLTHILPADDFFLNIERERDRSDRTGREFSLLVFDVKRSSEDSDRAKRLAGALTRRMRSIDTAGWLDRRLSVLLPETGPDGARKLADDLLRKQDGKPPVDYIVFSYPFEKNRSGIESEISIGVTKYTFCSSRH